MLAPRTLLVALLTLAPPAVSADDKADRQIEETARTSHTFRRVLPNTIEVRVRDGVATLAGRVGDMDQARLAEDTVANIDGVRRVDNQIKFDPKARVASDEWLAVKIRSKLLLNRDISLMHTRVDVKDGVVTLTGTADSPAQKTRTETAIKEIVGVRQVRNHLEIAQRTADDGRKGQRPKAGPSLPAGAGLPTGRDRVTAPNPEASESGLEDAAITTQIKFQLLRHEDTSVLKTTIETAGGHVVITGEAASDAQRELVTELARGVRGVSQVDNRMTVKRK